jgi:hypothetical protein
VVDDELSASLEQIEQLCWADSFSLASSSLRATSHSARDTIRFIIMAFSPLTG